MNKIMEPIKKILLTEDELKECVAKLATKIDHDYADKEPLMVSVLSGSFIFVADLIRAVSIPVEISFLFASSYGSSTVSSGKLEITAGKGFEPNGRDIIIVEDIIDSGYTLKNLVEYLYECGAASVEICTLLDKPSRREVEVDVKYIGFKVPDEFVIGYGLDFDYKYRQYPFIGVLKNEYYE